MIEAGTGQEALGILGTGGVDIALLDTGIPDLSPGELQVSILANPASAAVPLIFTGSAGIDPQPPAGEAFLPLPLGVDELVQTIRRLLGSKSSTANS